MREIARCKEMITYAGSVNHDHIHVLIGIPPNLLSIASSTISEGTGEYSFDLDLRR